MPLPTEKKTTATTITKEEAKLALEKLRSTEKWKRYYQEIILKSSLAKPAFKDEEQAKRYIDKLVLMPVDHKNPFNGFDEYWRNRK